MGGDRVGGDNKARRGGSEIDRSGMNDVEVDGSEFEVDEVGKKAISPKIRLNPKRR